MFDCCFTAYFFPPFPRYRTEIGFVSAITRNPDLTSWRKLFHDGHWVVYPTGLMTSKFYFHPVSWQSALASYVLPASCLSPGDGGESRGSEHVRPIIHLWRLFSCPVPRKLTAGNYDLILDHIFNGTFTFFLTVWIPAGLCLQRLFLQFRRSLQWATWLSSKSSDKLLLESEHPLS